MKTMNAPELINRYITVRHQINIALETIQSLSSVLATFKDCPEEQIHFDPWAFGHVHQLILTNVLNIHEVLADFLDIDEETSMLAIAAGKRKK